MANPSPNPTTVNMTAPLPPRMNGSSTSTTPARTPRSGTPVATHLALSNKNHKIHEKTGYTDITFAGKAEQKQRVTEALRSKGFMPELYISHEVHTISRDKKADFIRLNGSTGI